MFKLLLLLLYIEGVAGNRFEFEDIPNCLPQVDKLSTLSPPKACRIIGVQGTWDLSVACKK